MANVKKFIGYTTTAKTVYGIIERQVDSYLLNDADGAFAAAPADPYISFTEHTTIKGEYVLSESRTAWNDGLYKSTVYEQAGGSPAPVSDLVVAFQYMYIESDLEVVNDSKVVDILVDTGTTIPGTITTMQADLDNPDQYKADVSTLATATALATAQTDLDTITGSDGVTLATAQSLYAPNKVIPDAAGTAATLHGITNGKIDVVDGIVDSVLVDSTAIKAKTDNLPSGIAKNVALSNFQFYMVLSSDHVTEATEKTVLGTISKDGGAFAALTNAITEIANGMYKVNLTQTEMNADVVTLKFTETDCDQRIITVYTT